MYSMCMDEYLTDEEIKNRIRSGRRVRRARRRRMILCAAAAIAVAAGLLVGALIGSLDPSRKEARDPKFVPVAADMPLIQTGMSQIGNKGGKKFWSWAGFDSHVSWCACFVSWCEAENGYIKSGAAPSFTVVTDGIDWFKGKGQWLDKSATPSAGDIIFFDWEDDGYRDHVGIVTAVIGDEVFTVEGNSSDRCRVKRYTVGDACIEGYGHIEQ